MPIGVSLLISIAVKFFIRLGVECCEHYTPEVQEKLKAKIAKLTPGTRFDEGAWLLVNGSIKLICRALNELEVKSASDRNVMRVVDRVIQHKLAFEAEQE